MNPGCSMDVLERVMDERSADLATALTEIGFTHEEARRFLLPARAELVRSVAWLAATVELELLEADAVVSDVLACMPGRALAFQVGLTPAKAWAGLREVVPTVLEASRGCKNSPAIDGSAPVGAEAPTDETLTRFDVGFGLTLERWRRRVGGSNGSDPRAEPIGVTHPIFGRLLSS